ncbi:MAG: hypothetical protein JNN03_13950 [Rubrivivax sp.]|nr:hypothetical protein [Rubrivivax sp.]
MTRNSELPYGPYTRRAAMAAWAAWIASAVYSLIALVAILLLSGCGGVDSGGTGATPASVTVGPVSGFGSVVVGGIHHDESGAQIVDDDGQPLDTQALQLGTMTAIEGSAIVDSGTRRDSTALRVRVVEQVIGPLESVEPSGTVLRVLGQRVVVTPTTVLDARLSGGLTSLRAGDVLAVFGQLDVADARIVATRIEPRTQAPAYVLRAPVDTYERGLRRLLMGGVAIDLSALGEADLPASLPAGTLARVKLQPQRTGTEWIASALRPAGLMLGDSEQVEIEGRITLFASPQDFSVDGVPVDARGATFEGGTASLAVGARVEVEGRTVGGTLVARKVELESDDESDGRRFELEGRISALDTTALTFVVRGVTVSYAGTPRFEGGTVADLALNRRVAVKGTLSADRTRLQATSIHVEL